jgi:NitT/TauT family transport system ATP-binding protein
MPGGAELVVRIDSKSYPAACGMRREVLSGVTFRAGRGEILALLAPSGAGKTTLLRTVLGLDRDFHGSVTRPEGRLGVMFQEPRLLPWLSVAENLDLVEGDAEDEIPARLAEVGLGDAAGLHPRALSLGMARRVALVRALLGAPALLALDEPFASLDPQAAASLAALVVRQAREHGALVLLATHDLDQALGLADRLLVLGGRPARLAADWPVARPAAPSALRRELLAAFPFLRGGDDGVADAR